MNALAAAALVLAASGCDKVLGLQPLTLPTLPNVVGTQHLLWAANGSDGLATEVEAPASPGSLVATVRAGGVERTIDVAEDGSFAFAVPHAGDVYTLKFEHALATSSYQLDAPVLDLRMRIGGRPDRLVVPAGTELDWTITNRATVTASPGFQLERLYTTGLWSLSAALPSTDPIALDWRQMQSLAGPLGLLEAAQNDGLTYVAFATDPATGGTRIAYTARAQPVSTAAGTQTMLTSTATALPLAQCTTLNAQLRSESDRYGAMLQSDAQPRTAFWAINYQPSVVLTIAYTLASRQQDAPTPFADVSGQQVRYGDAYPGGKRFARLYVEWSRALPGGPVIFYSSDAVFPVETAGSCPTTTLPAGKLAIATQVTLDGTALASDDQVVTIDHATDPVVEWAPTATGDVHWYAIILYEVIGTSLTIRANTWTGRARAELPVESLKTGHSYIVRVTSQLGYPNFADGDLRTVVSPTPGEPVAGSADFWTTTFTVQ